MGDYVEQYHPPAEARIFEELPCPVNNQALVIEILLLLK